MITWVYVIKKDQNLNCFNMQMLTIFQTPTKLDLKCIVFTYGGTAISWRLIKQIMETCELALFRDNAVKLYEDKVVCIAQIKGCIKGDKIKHISLKFFYIHQLQKSDQNAIQRVRSSDNLANLIIHKVIVNCNTQESHWNTSTQRSSCCTTRENIIMSA